MPFAIWIKRTHCSLVARLILRILLTVLSSFLSASFGLKSPINLPRNRLRSPPSRLVLRSLGFNFVWTLKMENTPVRSKFWRKNCLVWMRFKRPVPVRRISANADAASMYNLCCTLSLFPSFHLQQETCTSDTRKDSPPSNHWQHTTQPRNWKVLLKLGFGKCLWVMIHWERSILNW